MERRVRPRKAQGVRPKKERVVAGVPSEILEKIVLFVEPDVLRRLLVYRRVHSCVEDSALILNARCHTENQSQEKCKEILRKAKQVFSAITAGNQMPRVFVIQQADITGMAVISDRLYISSDDKHVCSYSLGGGLVCDFDGHTGGVWSFCHNGELLITGSTDKTAKIWYLTSGIARCDLQLHRSTVRIVESIGEYVFTGSRDATIGVWSTSGSLLHVLSGHTLSIRCLACTDDYLVSGSYDGQVQLWNYKRGRLIRTLAVHQRRVYTVKIYRGCVVSTGLDAAVIVTRFNGTTVASHHLHSSLVVWLDFEDNYIVSSGEDGLIIKYDFINKRAMYSIQAGSSIKGQAIFNNLLLVATQATVKAYSFATGKPVAQIFSASCITTLYAKGSRIIIGYRDQSELKIAIFDYSQECVS